MSYLEPIDTTAYSYEEWIRFVFDHPVTEKSWYFTEEMHFECNPAVVITYYTRLFLDPCAILSSYDEARLEQGFWFIVHNQLGQWLWDDDVPLDLRLGCVRSMPTIFRDFLQDHPLEQACFMWWDMLRCFNGRPEPRIIDAMVGALEEILRLPSRHCQMSALHGLGHLSDEMNHESREPIIRAFLRKNENLDPELIRYAEMVIAGKML